MRRTLCRAALAALLLPMISFLPAGCGREEVAPPAGLDPRADELLQEMSDLLSATQRLSFGASELRDVVSADGEVRQLAIDHTTYLERPDRLRRELSVEGDTATVVYNQGSMGVHGTRQSFYALAEVPPTLDETLDFLSQRLDMKMPIADLLYSSPYESYVDSSTTGQYLGEETVEGTSCHHLAFQHPAIDFEMWLESGDRPLPCKLVLSYKLDEGAPTSVLTFREWNLSPEFGSTPFEYKPPDGYVRIPFRGRGGERVPEPAADN